MPAFAHLRHKFNLSQRDKISLVLQPSPCFPDTQVINSICGNKYHSVPKGAGRKSTQGSYCAHGKQGQAESKGVKLARGQRGQDGMHLEWCEQMPL